MWGYVAVAVPALLGIRGFAPYVVAALVVAAADIVGVSIAISAPDALTRGGMLGGLAVVALVTAIVWWRLGRPRVVPARPSTDVVASVRASPVAAIVVIAAAVALLFELYIGLRVAPNNWDSMTYHLSRAAYWLENESVGQYPGASVRQLGSAPNGEILQAWTMLVTGTDRWTQLVQWLALVGLALSIYSGARLVRFGPTPAAFAAGLFVILPMPILQGATTQNDLVVSFFIAAAAVFAARGLRDHHLGDVAVASAAAGLAIGTKGTALLAGPSLLIIVVAALWRHRPGRRFVGIALACVVAGIAVFGAYNYVLNYKNTHDVFGGVKEQVSGPNPDPLKNALHDLWTFADAPGVDVSWLEQLLHGPATTILGGIAGDDYPFSIDTAVDEDTAAFGLVGFVVLPLLLLAVLLWRRAPVSAKVLALASVVYLLIFAFNIDENPWLGRLLLPGVALAAPLFAVLARRPLLAGTAAALALASLIPCLLHNANKPLLLPPKGLSSFKCVV